MLQTNPLLRINDARMIYVGFPGTTLACLLRVSHGTTVQQQYVAELRKDLETHHAPR